MDKTVISYLLDRLKEIGIAEIFGIPGDYSFPVNDAICLDPELRWIGCCNELNAAFAADGYARIKGCSALCTTYGVGELSAINGIAGAYAEYLPVIHLVGMPKLSIQKSRLIMHHTLGNGEFDLFHKMTEPVVCASTILTAENSVAEVDRVLDAALTHKRPVYIAIPADSATQKVSCPHPVKPSAPESNKATLEKCIEAILDKYSASQNPTAIAGVLLRRYNLREKGEKLLNKTGLPFSTLFMGKSTIDETNPNHIGLYNGRMVSCAVREYMEASDFVLSLGVIASDINTGAFTADIDPHVEVRILPESTIVGHAEYQGILMKDVIDALIEQMPPATIKNPFSSEPSPGAKGAPDEEITAQSLYPRLEAFFRPDDIIIAETGTISMGTATAKLPKGAEYHNQTLWGSIGWATPASFGAATAAPKRRTVLLTGEGSHQMTVQEISQFARLGLTPIIICLNNDGYLIERVLCVDPNIYYNDLALWNYSKLPEAFGMDGWKSFRATTNAELDEALNQAQKADSGVYIEVVTPKMAASDMAEALNGKVFGEG